MSESILAILRHEHHEIQDILEQIERAKRTSVRVSLFNKLKGLLVPHMAGEEKTLYVKLKNESHEKAAELIANDADLEHKELKEFLQRLTLMEPETSDWMKEFHSFKDHVDMHFREEETEMFDEAKEDFTRDELERLTVDFEEAKHRPTL